MRPGVRVTKKSTKLFCTAVGSTFVILFRYYIFKMTHREFSQSYEEAISLIRQLKLANDSLNKAIGVDHPSSINQRLAAAASSHQQRINRTEQLLLLLSQSYLDPDTSRKIGTAKQQFRIQKDRHNTLLQNVETQSKLDSTTANTIVNYTARIHGNTEGNTHGNTIVNYSAKSSSISYSPPSSYVPSKEAVHEQSELRSIQLQVQHKILRERSAQIDSVTRSLINVQNVYRETEQMVFSQGENLDIISEDIFKAKHNVQEGLTNLVEAAEEQKKAKRKYIVASLLLILAVVAIIIIFAM